jgi:hypothetical protein
VILLTVESISHLSTCGFVSSAKAIEMTFPPGTTFKSHRDPISASGGMVEKL